MNRSLGIAVAFAALVCCNGHVESSECSSPTSCFPASAGKESGTDTAAPTGGGNSPSGGGGALNFGGYDAGGSSGGNTVVEHRVGRACSVAAECGTGFECITPGSGVFDSEGPGKGYCTKACATDADCAELSYDYCHTFAAGNAYCFKRCEFGPPALTAFDPKKCFGRQEVACKPVYDPAGNFTHAECTPQCNSDGDCGAGLRCNPRTGLCGSTVSSGKDVGEPCVAASETGTDVCKGVCADFHGISGTDPSSCTQGCVFGATPNCGWDGPGTGPAGATCLVAPIAVEAHGGPGIGDYGLCSPLCDCTSDCKLTSLVCRAWQGPNAADLETYFGRRGYCTSESSTDAGLGIVLTICDGG